MKQLSSPSDISFFSLALRFIVVLAFVLAATWASHMIRDALNLHMMPENEQQVHRAIMIGSIAYIGLLTIPFVPGAEIGIAMMTAFGASIAPLIYGATVLAMLLSYTIGRLLPIKVLERLLSVLGMARAADFVARTEQLSRDERLAKLMGGAPPRIVSLALRNRYVALALAVNIPGNAIIGGGGGIMMMAGLSGLFAPLPTVLTMIIAVSPVPLAVMRFGI